MARKQGREYIRGEEGENYPEESELYGLNSRNLKWIKLALAVAVSLFLVLLVFAAFVMSREHRGGKEKVSLNPIKEEVTELQVEKIVPTTELMTEPIETTVAQESGRVERRIDAQEAAAVVAQVQDLLDFGKSVELANEDLADYQVGAMNDVETQMGDYIRQQVQALQASIPEDLGIKIQEDTVSKTLEMPLSAASEMGNFEETGVQLWVFAEIANIRQDANINAPKLGEAIRGDFVWEVSTNGSWSYVVFQDGTAGYIYKDLLREVEVEHETVEVVVLNSAELDNLTPLDATLYSNNSGVRIRKDPSTDAEIIGELYYGDSIQCIAYGIDWYQVKTSSGEIGYIYGDYLQFEPPEEFDVFEQSSGEEIKDLEDFKDQNEWYDEEAVAAQPTEGGQGLVNLALQHVGKAYVLGATGPDAFDCSGFVQFLLGQMGVTVGRTTWDQVNAGTGVNWNGDIGNLLPGDIILLGKGTDVYHSMIYVGNGQIVHAGNESTGVCVDKIDWYMDQIAHVRRIFY